MRGALLLLVVLLVLLLLLLVLLLILMMLLLLLLSLKRGNRRKVVLAQVGGRSARVHRHGRKSGPMLLLLLLLSRRWRRRLLQHRRLRWLLHLCGGGAHRSCRPSERFRGRRRPTLAFRSVGSFLLESSLFFFGCSTTACFDEDGGEGWGPDGQRRGLEMRRIFCVVE